MRPGQALGLISVLFLGCGDSRSESKGRVVSGNQTEGKPGSTPVGKTLPDVWYVAWGYASGTWLAHRPYASREEAERELKGKETGVDVELRKVVKDSPREKIRVDGRDIFRDVDIDTSEELGSMGLITLFRCAKLQCSSFKPVRQHF